MTARIATIIIGRNEGARLVACLASVPKDRGEIVYVDSGSTDGSVAAAEEAGAKVVELDPSAPFTAARARNEGVAAIEAPHDYIQFIDGDCTLDAGWLDTAVAFLEATPKAGVVCGRRRERFPEASIYNRICDVEWDMSLGPRITCGGDSLMRFDMFKEAGGFLPNVIAGEEPELCARLRKAGWEIWRIEGEMTLHDAAILRFGQYWKRCRRGGYAYAIGADLHRLWVSRVVKALIWGVGLPLVIVLAVFLFGPIAWALVLIYPLQIARMARGIDRDIHGDGFAWRYAALMMVGKFAEAVGVLEFALKKLRGQTATIIEYK